MKKFNQKRLSFIGGVFLIFFNQQSLEKLPEIKTTNNLKNSNINISFIDIHINNSIYYDRKD